MSEREDPPGAQRAGPLDPARDDRGAGGPRPLDPDAPLRGGTVFLPRSTYRRRRVLDALRLWPILGMILLALPVIWHGAGQDNVTAMGYVFGSWAVLIGGAAFLSRLTRQTETGAAPPDASSDPVGAHPHAGRGDEGGA